MAFCPAVPGLAPEASIKSIAIAGIQRLLLCTGLRSRAGPCSPLRNEHGDQAGRVTAAAGEEDALSLRYQSMRDAWENRVRGASRQAQARYYETAAGNVDPTLGIVKSLIS